MKYIHPRHIYRKMILVIQDLSSLMHKLKIAKFIHKMNDTAQNIGMEHSRFINPSGLPEKKKISVSTARDLTKLISYSMNYPLLIDYFKIHTYEINLRKRVEFIESTFVKRSIGNYAEIILGKTGSGWGINNLAFVAKIMGDMYACAIMNANSEDERFDAMEELIEVVRERMCGGKSLSVIKARTACAYKLSYIKNRYQLAEVVYEQRADEVIPTMSVSKLLTMIVAINNGCDLNLKFTIKPADINIKVESSGAIFMVGDRVCLKDLFLATLLPSSCQAANVIARVC